jgi:hypothetical protein
VQCNFTRNLQQEECCRAKYDLVLFNVRVAGWESSAGMLWKPQGGRLIGVRKLATRAPLHRGSQGVTNCDLVDMYSVLQNRSFLMTNDIGLHPTQSAKPNA